MLTKLPLKASIHKLSKLWASAGISLVIIPHISKTYINGATKWLSNDMAMIAISPKGGYEDIFWFTFFHELGHVLQEKKQAVFVDGEDYINDDSERDAVNIGIIVSRLMKDGYIEYSNKSFEQLRRKISNRK